MTGPWAHVDAVPEWMARHTLDELGCEHMETVYDYMEGACGPRLR